MTITQKIKKYATFELLSGTYHKVGGYFEDSLNLPKDAIEITDAEEIALNNGKDFKDLVTRELVDTPPIVVPLDTLKETALRTAGATFASKRDAVRYVKVSDGNTYGFDCANEDITNFMAGWKRAELTGSTFYKVYLSPTEKTIVTLTATDFATVSNEVSNSQLLAYSWYESIKAQILACTTKAELESIVIK